MKHPIVRRPNFVTTPSPHKIPARAWCIVVLVALALLLFILDRQVLAVLKTTLKTRMGWDIPWYTLTDSFDADIGVDEWHGTNAFIRDGDRVFRTYFIKSRGDEALGSTWSYLDMTALGRQEEWEDSPAGYPQTPPYKWWNWHDSYVPGAAPDKRWVEVSDAGVAAFRDRKASAKP